MSLTATFGRFLALLDDPAAGEALHACYAPEAGLCYRLEVTPAGDIAPAEFASAMAAMATLRQAAPKPAITDLALVSSQEGPDGTVAWFSGKEATDGHVLHIAVGFRGERLGWVTLADKPADWSYAHGRFQTIADFSFAQGASMVLPRSWLDVAYYRLHGHARPPLLVLPEARFRCHGEAACCSVVYRVEVGPGAQAVIDAIPWQEIEPSLEGTQLPVIEDGRRLLKEAGEVCRFLGPQKQCRIHQAAGRAVFTPCAVHPFNFTATPDGVAVSGVATCPTVRANLGPTLPERADDLYMRLAMVPPEDPTGPYRLAEGHEVDWPTYREIEGALIALLGRTALPLRQRLFLGGKLIEATLRGEAFDEAAWAAGPAVDGEDDQVARAGLLGMTAGQAELTPGGGPADDHQLRWLIENLLFSKRFVRATDLRTAHHVGVLAYALAHHVGQLDEQRFWALTGYFWHRGLAERIAAQPDAFRWLRAPAFGAWMLAHRFAP